MKEYLIYLFFLVSSFLITVTIEYIILPFLRGRAKQPIYAEGPSWHMSKKGTPTMGGIAFVLSISTLLILYSVFTIKTEGASSPAYSVLIGTIFAVGNALIGVFDDLLKLKNGKNAGLSPLQKLVLQFMLALLFLMANAYFVSNKTQINFFFGSLNLNFLYYPLAVIILLGTINCANLTDGIDGLASSVGASIGFVLMLIGLNTSRHIVISAMALIGGTIGFLCFNRNPAKIFMGDTGSLFLGALIASITFTIGNPLIILFAGIVYVIEGLSVILQVIYFKITGKRLFKMAPLHHHLEKGGMSENKICFIMSVITLIFSALIPFILRW